MFQLYVVLSRKKDEEIMQNMGAGGSNESFTIFSPSYIYIYIYIYIKARFRNEYRENTRKL